MRIFILMLIILTPMMSYSKTENLKAIAYGKIMEDKESRSQALGFYPKQMVIDRDLKGKKQKMQLKAFEDLNLDLSIELSDIRSLKRASWIGKIDGDAESEVFISRYNNSVVIDITKGDKHYQIMPSKNGNYKIEELDINKLPRDTISDIVEDAYISADEQIIADDTVSFSEMGIVTIDVIVVFTNDAATLIGNNDALIAYADNAANSFNSYAANSDTISRLRVVHAYASDANSSGSITTDLNRISSSTDGYFDEVYPKRNSYGADIIHLITASGNKCGVAHIRGFVSVSAKKCAISNKTFAHETAHNIGCNHDPDHASGTGYNFGHRYYGLSGKQYRTIMSYAPGARIKYFSNPSISHDGVATGIPDERDNARVLNERSAITASFRQTVVPNQNPVISLSTTNINFGRVNVGESGAYTIKINNLGINTLNISAIYLSGNGFSINHNCSSVEYEQTCSLDIIFTPEADGTFFGSLEILSNAENGTINVSLSGEGYSSIPELSTSSAIQFGQVNIGTSSDNSLVIANTGAANLNISSIVLNDSTGAFTKSSDGCSGKSLSPNANCQLILSFTPSADISYSASLNISSNDPNQKVKTLSLSGTGIKIKKWRQRRQKSL